MTEDASVAHGTSNEIYTKYSAALGSSNTITLSSIALNAATVTSAGSGTTFVSIPVPPAYFLALQHSVSSIVVLLTGIDTSTLRVSAALYYNTSINALTSRNVLSGVNLLSNIGYISGSIDTSTMTISIDTTTLILTSADITVSSFEYKSLNSNSMAIGDSNTINSPKSLAVGRNNLVQNSESIAIGNNNTIGSTSIAGANNFIIGNDSTTSTSNAIILGSTNTILSASDYSIILGGENNIVYEDSEHSTVVGGWTNLAIGEFSAVLGGENNTASSSHCTVLGGGFNNAVQSYDIVGGSNNTASGGSSLALGGAFNTASDSNAAVFGGLFNTASGQKSTVCGGNSNQATGSISIVLGGTDNIASGAQSIAAGTNARATHTSSMVFATSGFIGNVSSTNTNQCTISAYNGVVLGTNVLVTNALSATTLYGNGSNLTGIVGGSGGTVQGTDATYDIRATLDGITPGDPRAENSVDLQTFRYNTTEIASGAASVISGGRANTALGEGAVVAGGEYNESNAQYSFSVGYDNRANGDYSAVLGGIQNVAGGAQSIAAGTQARARHISSMVFATSGFTAPVSSTNTNQFMVSAFGGVVLGTNVLVTNALSATTLYGNGSNLTGIAGSGGTVQGTDATYDIQATNEGAVAGNTRGENSVDLQTLRSVGAEVASGIQSVIMGGGYNKAIGQGATVAGGEYNFATGQYTFTTGYQNFATANYSTIVGGQFHEASGEHSSVLGGYYNIATNQYDVVCGGNSNQATGGTSITLGGFDNIASGKQSIAAGVQTRAKHVGSMVFATSGFTAPVSSTNTNQFTVSAYNGVVLGTNVLVTNALSATTLYGDGSNLTGIVGGSGGTVQGTDYTYDIQATNDGAIPGDPRGEYSVDLQTARNGGDEVASGEGSVIAGGSFNKANVQGATVAGGYYNYSTGQFAFTTGYYNVATADYATIVGGNFNAANGPSTAILGGDYNIATSQYDVVCGGNSNQANGGTSIVLGGHYNVAQGERSLAAGSESFAAHTGSMVFATSGFTTPVSSTNTNQFMVSAFGGVVLGQNVTINGSVNHNTIVTNLLDTTVTVGTSAIDTIPVANTAAFYDIFIKNGSNLRASNVILATDNSANVSLIETSCGDIGTTAGIVLSAAYTGGFATLYTVVTTGTWQIKGSKKVV